MQTAVQTPSRATSRVDPRLRTTLTAIPTWMVHKSVHETPLTYLMEQREHQIQVGCDLTNFGVGALQVMDAFRQSVMAACHTVYGVPPTWAFAMNSISTVLTTEGRALLEEEPALAIRLTFEPVTREKHLRSAVITAELIHGDVVVGEASAEIVLLSPDQYLRVREGRQRRSHRCDLPRVRPDRVGVASASRVLLAAAPSAGPQQLVLDTDHLAFCDHAVDHVPGMTLLEAVRQALVLRGWSEPTGWVARFHRYVEVEAALSVDLASVNEHGGVARILDGDDEVVVVTLSQDVSAPAAK